MSPAKRGRQADPAYSAKHEQRLLQIWERAAGAEWGIAITTPRPDSLKRDLYIFRRARREAGDTRFDHLRIAQPPDAERAKEEIWITLTEEGIRARQEQRTKD